MHDGFRAGARGLLQAEGFEVLGEAVDGDSALEAVRRLRPQVVVLDVQLPGLDGFGHQRIAVETEPAGRRADFQPRGAHLPAAAGDEPGARVHPSRS